MQKHPAQHGDTPVRASSQQVTPRIHSSVNGRCAFRKKKYVSPHRPALPCPSVLGLRLFGLHFHIHVSIRSSEFDTRTPRRMTATSVLSRSTLAHIRQSDIQCSLFEIWILEISSVHFGRAPTVLEIHASPTGHSPRYMATHGSSSMSASALSLGGYRIVSHTLPLSFVTKPSRLPSLPRVGRLFVAAALSVCVA